MSPVSPVKPVMDDAWARALACYHEGRFRQADKLLKKRYRKGGYDANGRLLCGMVAVALENWREAHEHLERAVRQLPQQVEAWIALGNAARALNRMDEAIAHYRQALQLQPRVEACHNLAAVLQDTGDLLQALEYYQRALQLDPNFALSLRARAPLLARLRRVEAADAAYADLRQRYPHDAALRIEHASWLEQSNRVDEAHKALPECSELDATQVASCESLRAQLMIREGRLEEAHELLQRVYHETRAGHLGFRLGRLCDRLGYHSEAWRYFNIGNRYRRSQWAFERLLRQPLFEYLEDRLQRMQHLEISPEIEADDGPVPVFLIGLPRSGTTLLNRLLDLHDDVQVLEETHALRVAADELEGGADPAAARQAYWQQVAGHASIRPGTLVIDKHPLHAMQLDQLPVVFAGARVIYLHRDPLDAALSCYMQDFDPGPVTVRFTDLEETARVCQAFIQLMDGFSDKAGDAVLHVDYEHLVTAPEAEMQRIFGFLGLSWQAGDFDPGRGLEVAEPVMTASYDQVVRPVYTEAIGRWRHYADSIEVLRRYLEDDGKAPGNG